MFRHEQGPRRPKTLRSIRERGWTVLGWFGTCPATYPVFAQARRDSPRKLEAVRDPSETPVRERARAKARSGAKAYGRTRGEHATSARARSTESNTLKGRRTP